MSISLSLNPRSAASPKMLDDQAQGLHEVFKIGALAADVEAESLDDQAGIVGRRDEIDRLAGGQPNLLDSSTIAPVLGTFNRKASPACGACFLILPISSQLSYVTSGL